MSTIMLTQPMKRAEAQTVVAKTVYEPVFKETLKQAGFNVTDEQLPRYIRFAEQLRDDYDAERQAPSNDPLARAEALYEKEAAARSRQPAQNARNVKTAASTLARDPMVAHAVLSYFAAANQPA